MSPDDGNVIKIDVKSVSGFYRRLDGTYGVPVPKPSDGIHFLYIEDGEVAGFFRRKEAERGGEYYEPHRNLSGKYANS
ncbi:hypothetical protein OSJ57_17690 [Sphingomonas sp. HH69]